MNRYDPSTGMWNFPGTEGLVVAAVFIIYLLLNVLGAAIGGFR